MRRLAHVGPARLDLIIRPDGDVEFLLSVAIEVSNQKTAIPVLLIEPAFECARRARAKLLPRFRNLLAQEEHAAGEGAGGAQTYEFLHC